MMLKNIKLILVSIALILGCCHETMANAAQKIVRVEDRKVTHYSGKLYPNLLPGEKEVYRTFRGADIFMKELPDYSKRHNVVIFDLRGYIAGNIDNITEELCNVLTREKQEEHSQRSMTSTGR